MDILAATPLTANFVKSVLAAGTTTTLSQTSACHFAIRGKLYKQASAWSNQATPTTDYNTGSAFLGVKANYGSIFVVGLNSSGAMKVVQGSIVPLDASGAFIQAPQLPDVPNDICPIGYVIIKAGSTADATTGWIFGSSNNSSVTGITYTFGDLSTLPDRPIVS